MAPPPPPPTAGGRRRINPKYYIVAGLTAILAAAVVVTVFFVLLSPARIYFSVANARSTATGGGGVVLSFTVAANNTSRRAAVKYQSLFVDLSNNTGVDIVSWTRVQLVNTSSSDDVDTWYPRGTQVVVGGTLEMQPGPWTSDFFAGGEVGEAPLTVQVTAVARFKVAGIRTRLYDIAVRCGPVFFVDPDRRRRQRRRGRGGGASAPAVVVDCSPVSLA